MPIISEIGRKSWSVRALMALIYLVLILGGVTMLYPFLLMVSTSVTSYVDYGEYRLVPRWLYDDEAKFRKFLYEKYGMIKTYSEMHAADYTSFQEIRPAAAGPAREALDRRVALWREFKRTLDPAEFGVWCVGQTNISGKADVLWRDYLRRTYDGDLDALRRDMDKQLFAFTEAFAPYEKPEGRLWHGIAGREGEVWRGFKQALDPAFRRPTDAVVLWQRYLRYRYRKLDRLNEAFGTSFGDFKDVPLLRTRPADGELRKDWDWLVRNELPYRFVALRDGDAQYRRFLASSFGDLAAVNKGLETSYASLDAVRWPPDAGSARELDAVSRFLREAADPAEASIDTPDMRYADFLKAKFQGDLAGLNAALDGKCSAFDDVRPPYDEEDRWEFRTARASWVMWFATHNYLEVIDYIAIRGRALWNTVILVGAMVLCALTINPLAAYALSRFRLGYTNQVLLFLLATMAFPYEVALIPNFLLMRRFPLWTWLIGLAVGLVVAIVVVRRTTGARKLLAIPAGLGAAVLSGLYLTPLVGRAFGLDIGPVSLLNTFAALILPGMANGYAIFLLKGFFDSLPEELFEAGKIDGASELRMFWQVAFPLSKPIFAVLALQTFTAVYGSYIWALVVCQSDRMWTLMVYIFQLQTFAPPYVTMAATVLASLPTLLVFIFAQKTIMRGIIIPAYK